MSDTTPYPQPDRPVTFERPAPAQAPAPQPHLRTNDTVAGPAESAPVPYGTPAPEGVSDAAWAQEVEALVPDGYVRVPLSGVDETDEEVTIDVVAQLPGRWKASSMRLLHTGNLDAFFASILTSDSYDDYVDLDPDQDAIGDLMRELETAGGESVKKSSGRRRSSRPTRRR